MSEMQKNQTILKKAQAEVMRIYKVLKKIKRANIGKREIFDWILQKSCHSEGYVEEAAFHELDPPFSFILRRVKGNWWTPWILEPKSSLNEYMWAIQEETQEYVWIEKKK